MLRLLMPLIFALAMVLPTAVRAQEAAKGVFDYSLRHYAVLLGLAMLGGFVSWWGKIVRGVIPKWSLSHLIGELATSAFAGLLAFYLCEWANFPSLLTAAFTGVSGHMGTRAIDLFENFMARKFGPSGNPDQG